VGPRDGVNAAVNTEEKPRIFLESSPSVTIFILNLYFTHKKRGIS